MKVTRSLITFGASLHLAPVFIKLDALLLCLMHHSSSRLGVRELAASEHPAARSLLTAIDSIKLDTVVEKERSRLLRSRGILISDAPDGGNTTVSDACAVSKSPRQAGLLASLARQFSPQYAIELGTNVGISSAYIARAITGTLFTFEGSTDRLNLATQVHATLGISNVRYVDGLFNDTLNDALKKIPQVDFVFIDGHHEYQATLDYFGKIVSHASPGAVFVFDDIRWSIGMKQAWNDLRADARFSLVVDLWTMGLCVLREATESRLATAPIACY